MSIDAAFYVFFLLAGMAVGAIGMGLWLLPKFIDLRNQLDNAWDDVGTALQTPSDNSTGPEYRNYMLGRLRQIQEERKRGK